MFDSPEANLDTSDRVTKNFVEDTCQHAAIYHDYISMLQGMANTQKNLVWSHRAEYDYYYDHLASLPKDVREAAEPAVCAIVATIEQGVISLGSAREGLSTAFDEACVSKMREIAKDMNSTSGRIAEQYLSAMEAFRTWRIANLDAVNVDLAPLLDARENYHPGKSGLFEKLFAAWAKETKPELNVSLTRSVVLDGLATIAPHLAQSYIASLKPFKAKLFGRKSSGTRVLLDEVDCTPCL